MKTSLLALAVIPLAFFVTGCGDACDDLADKLEDCGADTAGVTTEDCTDEQLTCAECLVDCLNDDCSNIAECAVDTCLNDCT